MSLDYQRLYRHRFAGVEQKVRQAVWNHIARHVHQAMDRPARVLDPAAGRCEFANAVPAPERWIVDQVDHADGGRDPRIKVVLSDVMKAPLPDGYFDGVFVSNFLEHLSGPDAIADFLAKMRRCMAPGGRIAVMGPNFKYCMDEYFDCADHIVALTHVSAAEHLAAAGFTLRRAVPRFLPYSFRSALPFSAALAGVYLSLPVFWPFFGKQFFLVAENPA